MVVLWLRWRELKQTPVNKEERIKRWPNSRAYKAMVRNAENYTNWVIRKIRRVCGEPPKGYKYNAMCLYMSKGSVERLHEGLFPMDWLNYAPKELEGLTDKQYAISKKEAFVRA